MLISRFREVTLDSAHLQASRIISHIVTDRRARSFDMLRTQILQLMDQKQWKTLAVTSPTPSCGKTVTALNLALSIARQPERRVLFVDLDFIKPMVATTLGLDFQVDAKDVLEERVAFQDAVTNAQIGDQQLLVVPCTPTSGSSELVASRAMATMFQTIKKDFPSHTTFWIYRRSYRPTTLSRYYRMSMLCCLFWPWEPPPLLKLKSARSTSRPQKLPGLSLIRCLRPIRLIITISGIRPASSRIVGSLCMPDCRIPCKDIRCSWLVLEAIVRARRD